MKSIILIQLLSFAIVFSNSCDRASQKTSSNVGNSNKAAKTEKSLMVEIVAFENRTIEAWKNKDGKFFEGFLSDKFIGIDNNGRTTKAMVVNAVSESPCEVKSYKSSDEDMFEISEGVVLMTMKLTLDYVCAGKAGTSPAWSASLYVRDGEKLSGMYHQEIAAAGAKGEPQEIPADATGSRLFEAQRANLRLNVTGRNQGSYGAFTRSSKITIHRV